MENNTSISQTRGCNTTVWTLERKQSKTVNVKAASKTGGTLQIHLDNVNGPVIAEIKVPKSDEWKIVEAPVTAIQSGINNLFVTLKEDGGVEVDWIRFE